MKPLDDLLLRACSIATCGAEVTMGTRESRSYDVAALLTFTGSGVSGALLIAAVRTGLPPNMCRVALLTDEERTDWLCEMGNRIMGAVSGLMTAQGLDVRMSTPSLICGSGLRLERARHAVPTHCTIEDSKGPVAVSLSMDGASMSLGKLAPRDEQPVGAEVLFLA